MPDVLSLLRRVLGFCPQCRCWFVYPKRRRMNTAYVNEESNWCCVCLRCFEEIEAYWRERWAEYYASVL